MLILLDGLSAQDSLLICLLSISTVLACVFLSFLVESPKKSIVAEVAKIVLEICI